MLTFRHKKQTSKNRADPTFKAKSKMILKQPCHPSVLTKHNKKRE